jgi:hypothetical protein
MHLRFLPAASLAASRWARRRPLSAGAESAMSWAERGAPRGRLPQSRGRAVAQASARRWWAVSSARAAVRMLCPGHAGGGERARAIAARTRRFQHALQCCRAVRVVPTCTRRAVVGLCEALSPQGKAPAAWRRRHGGFGRAHGRSAASVVVVVVVVVAARCSPSCRPVAGPARARTSTELADAPHHRDTATPRQDTSACALCIF